MLVICRDGDAVRACDESAEMVDNQLIPLDRFQYASCKAAVYPSELPKGTRKVMGLNQEDRVSLE